MRTVPLEPSVELPVGSRNAVLVYWVRGTHAGGSAGTFAGAPCGATKRCTGWEGRMRAVAMGTSVELP
eukprot:6775271-Pyramimonas_sp.AAC.1